MTTEPQRDPTRDTATASRPEKEGPTPPRATTPPDAPAEEEPPPTDADAPLDRVGLTVGPGVGPEGGPEVGAAAGTDGAAEDATCAALWHELQSALGSRVQPEQFETWFRRANVALVDDERVVIAVQNAFARDWLRSYYMDTLERSALAVLGSSRLIEIAVDPELAIPRDGTAPQEPTSPTTNAAGPAPNAPGTNSTPTAPTAPSGPLPAGLSTNPAPAPGAGLPPGVGPGSAPGGPGRDGAAQSGLLWNSDIVLNPKYTFENFVVGPCNRFGHAAAMGAGEAPGRHYNPFFLHGRVGVGKTHLLQAVCFLILDRYPTSRILYLSCETFVNHFISALENGDLSEFRDKYRNVDVLVVDDIHLLANKERTQEEFFHTFNALYNAGKQIVLSSDSPPKDIPTLQERLVSRFKWGMVTEIEPPCYETRMAIVKRKSRDRGGQVPDEVAQFIAERIDQNVRELEGAVTRLLAYSSMTGKPLSIPLAREALADVVHVRRGAPSMEDITSIVTEHFGVKLSELQSRKRTKAIAYPRQIAMYLARKVTRHSLEEIGRYYGGRDHSTVLYAIDRIQTQIGAEDPARDLVDSFLTQLVGGRA